MSTSTDQQVSTTEKEESSTDQKYDNWIPMVTKMVDWLYSFCERHFRETLEDRVSDIKYQISVCLKVLDSIPQEKRKSEYERSMFEFLRGKVCNAVPVFYSEEAERHLKNAIAIDPYMLDAWNCLGICAAMKGDYHTAKNCYQYVLERNEHNIVLRQVAELELACARAAVDPTQHIEESLKYAQRALTLDHTDGRCLYILGSTYLTSFLLDGGWELDKLLLSLEAYEKAEKTHEMRTYPNLQYDSGIVNRFLENYERSLILFSEAAQRNPSVDALHQLEITLKFLDKLERLLQGKSSATNNNKSKEKTKGKSKGKSQKKSMETSVSSLIQSLITIELNPSYNRATMDLLTQGLNKGIAVIGAVRCLLKYDYNAPVYYLLCDSDENSFLLTVFGIQREAIKQGDQVTLLEPFCKFVDFEWKEKRYQFKSLRVNLLNQVLVNGNALSPNFAHRESILCA